MKKIMLVCALLLSVGLSTTFAHFTENVSQEVISSFNKDFTGAQEVSWHDAKDFARATFKMNNQVMYAYYSKAGELLAVTRNISTSQLPINLQVKKGYTDYWVTDLFEMASGGVSTYYLTLEDGTQKVILKSSGSTGWEVYKKEKKVTE